MSTISSKNIIQTMLDNNGTYPGDPQADSIWEYTHAETKKTLWAVFWPGAINDLHYSPYVLNPRLLWSKETGHVGTPS